VETGQAVVVHHEQGVGDHGVEGLEAVDVLFAEFRAQGVTIVKPPQAVYWGGYSGYISDPDGFLWEIAHNPYLEKLR